jgi:flavin reductase (DIM6/NTAB) family NADH-FMN oxidoreductase RutF
MTHRYFDMNDLAADERYKLLSGSIVPRPIAFVSTLSEQGAINAAPFSFFNIMSTEPPIVALEIENFDDGSPKHTTMNIRATREFTINIVTPAIVDRMNVCAVEFDYGVDELAEAGLIAAPGERVRCPFIAESPAAFECRFFISLAISKTREMILGQIVGAHFREGLIDLASYRVDFSALDAIGRISGANYATTRDAFSLPGMTLEDWRRKIRKAT